MTHHFRTLTAVVSIDDDLDLRYPGYAMEVTRRALEALGFQDVQLRNAPNPTGAMPAHIEETA